LENPQDIVLLGRDLPFSEEFILDRFETIVSPPQREVNLLLLRIELAVGGQRLATHPSIILVQTTIVQTGKTKGLAESMESARRKKAEGPLQTRQAIHLWKHLADFASKRFWFALNR
jgi:hypothetical protein